MTTVLIGHSRMLTPVLQVEIDSGWIHRNWPTTRSSEFAPTDVGIKSEIYRNNQHEMLVAAGALWGIGHSGAQTVGADEPNSFQPGVFFGKGFGDLPDWLAWLRLQSDPNDCLTCDPTGRPYRWFNGTGGNLKKKPSPLGNRH